jgi:putative membrane protein
MTSVPDRPGLVTAVVSVVGYGAVVAVFAGVVPFPELSRATVDLLSHAIAAINLTALAAIVVGVRAVRRGDVERHHRAMTVAFALILTFLAVYLVKVGGGGTKLFEGPAVVKSYLYLPMLAVHLLLSVVSVPLVVDALVLGTVTPVDELPDTRHPRVGRIAVAAWGLSLALGLVTYLLLNHVYTFSYTTEALAVGVSVLGPG